MENQNIKRGPGLLALLVFVGAIVGIVYLSKLPAAPGAAKPPALSASVTSESSSSESSEDESSEDESSAGEPSGDEPSEDGAPDGTAAGKSLGDYFDGAKTWVLGLLHGKASLTQETVTVTDVYEFYDALGSGKIIEFSGLIALREADPPPVLGHREIAFEQHGLNYTLVIRNVKNLTIRGIGPAGTLANVPGLTPASGYLIRFENCKNITLENLAVRRTDRDVPGKSAGGLIAWTDCAEITLRNVAFSDGQQGLNLTRVASLTAENCVFGGERPLELHFAGGNAMQFRRCRAAAPLLFVSSPDISSGGIRWEDCTFEQNSREDLNRADLDFRCDGCRFQPDMTAILPEEEATP
ncbi:MAG: hypothetical protein LBJ11_05940 [Oscillospiraceae bacterium]|nr:hypothetical protein [Oscillospiraceae bacterium]